MMARSTTWLQSEAGYIDARPPPPIRRNLLATRGRTIHVGQSEKWRAGQMTSAVSPNPDIEWGLQQGRLAQASDQLQSLQTRMSVLADDDVIVHRNAQWTRDVDDRLGHRDIRLRWRGI